MTAILGVQKLARFHPNFSLFYSVSSVRSNLTGRKAVFRKAFIRSFQPKAPLSVMPFPTERIFSFISLQALSSQGRPSQAPL